MKPFDLEIWFGERVAVLGSNGSGKSHFLRLLAGGGRSRREHQPVADVGSPRSHTGIVSSAPGSARVLRADPRHPELLGRTLVDILHRGDDHRRLGREEASRALAATSWPTQAEQPFETLSGGQQARLQILLLELSGATLLLLDEPTDNLDLRSAEALEEALRLRGHGARGHPRPLVRPRFDRFLVFGATGGSTSPTSRSGTRNALPLVRRARER